MKTMFTNIFAVIFIYFIHVLFFVIIQWATNGLLGTSFEFNFLAGGLLLMIVRMLL